MLSFDWRFVFVGVCTQVSPFSLETSYDELAIYDGSGPVASLTGSSNTAFQVGQTIWCMWSQAHMICTHAN